MRKRSKIIIGGIFLVFVLAASSVYYYVFVWSRHHHRSVHREHGIAITAGDLARTFSENEQQGNTLYLDKTLLVSGTLLETGMNSEGRKTLLLQGDTASLAHVFCTLARNDSLPPLLTKMTIKGICTGFLADVILIDAIIPGNATASAAK